MANAYSSSKPPLGLEEVAPSPQYVNHFKPVTNTLLLPRAPIGKYWEGKPRTPDFGRPLPPPPTIFQKICGTQYRGTAEATAIAYAGAIHATSKACCPTFRVKAAHPLSACLQYDRKLSGGKVWIVKSRTDQFTMPGSPGDPRTSGSKDVSPRPAGKLDADDGMVSTDFANSEFDRIDGRIVQLVQRVLPGMPHLLSVPTRNPYLTQFPYENRNTPFEEWEVKPMQHMTLVASGTRGVAWVKGDWEEEMNAASPHSAGLSMVTTPRSERDPNKPPPVKMSLADYKAGRRPPSSSQATRSNPLLVVQGGQNGANRPSLSPTQQMIDQIVEGNAPKHLDRFRERPPHPDISRPPVQPPKRPKSPVFSWDVDPPPSDTLPKPVGQKERGRAVWPPAEEPDWKGKLSSGPPINPRPENPAMQGKQQPKRSLDTTEPSPPEKRVKLSNHQPSKTKESMHQRPSSSIKSIPVEEPFKNVSRKPNTSDIASDELRRTIGQEMVSEAVRGASPKLSTTSTSASQKDELKGETNRDINQPDSMPPLLSPLPPGLTSPDDHFEASNNQILEHERSSEIDPQSSLKQNMESEKPQQDQDTRSTELSDDDLELPPMLSPLPDWWMQQIAREKEELDKLGVPPATHNPNTVGARHERSRQPDAPGVARKTKTQAGSSVSAKGARGDANISKADRKTEESNSKANSSASRKSLIVKLKYEAGQKMPPSAAAAGPVSEDRKHSRPADDQEESTVKRSKLPANVELQRARTPLTPSVQSPAPSAPPTSQKGAFSTPKKGDAIKSVAMRKVDSSDGRILTPQAAITSTPASVEKPRVNGTDAKSIEVEALRVTHAKYFTLGQTLKRLADQVLKVKEPNPGPVSEEEKKLGAVIAIEAVIAFMVSFHAFDTCRHLERKQNFGDNWTQFFAFQNFAVERAKPFKKLYTTALLLGSVCHEALERVYAERLIHDPTGAPSDFVEKLATSSRARVHFWKRYCEANKASPVEFVISVSEAKITAASVLTEFCERNSIIWEKKVDL